MQHSIKPYFNGFADLKKFVMNGNIYTEWTISGSDPLFYVMGGSYTSDQEHCDLELHEIYHANMKVRETGLRLVYYPKTNSPEK